MPLDAGSRLGHYEILSLLGAGGMGEVYRARDPRLKRDVALKVLPDLFAADPERLARFEREAQALAALKHPHIATIYGIEEKEDVRALVLELVEGDTLDQQIARGALPVEECERLARQIADALEAAHEQGIVHRDLKPANIKITPDGAVKVLDFGLAKLTGGEAAGQSGSSAPLSMSPTMASPAMLTGINVLIGTVAYMSPEQARGKVADKRADIWAFGVVLYEMLTGRRAFAGESITEVAAAVIHQELVWDALPAATSSSVRLVVQRCLQKDPRQRFRDMGDVRLALDGAFVTDGAQAPVALPAGRGRRWLSIAAAAMAAALLAGAGVWLLSRPAPEPIHVTRFDVPSAAPRTLSPFISVSPDGRMIAFLAWEGETTAAVWVRPLDAAQSRPVASGEQRLGPVLFWSPDSRQIAFHADGRLRRVDVAGGPAETVAEAKNVAGGSWGVDGTIVFSNGATLMRVPASGGTPVELANRSGIDGGKSLPWFLPDGRHFLYLQLSTDERVQGIHVGSIDAEDAEQQPGRLIPAQHGAMYAPARGSSRGHLLFIRDGLVMAQEFDEQELTVAGDPVPLTGEPVETSAVFAAFGVSANGTLVYRRGGSVGVLTAVDRKGTRAPLLDAIKENRARNPRVSPDGRHLALIVDEQLWSYDLGGRPPIKLTFDGTYFTPAWTPDGRRIVAERTGQERSLYIVPADGSGTAEPIGPPGHYHPYGWTADGREIVAVRMPTTAASGDNPDLVRFGTVADAQVHAIAATAASDGISGQVSPNGRWIAYTSDSTGRAEVWVRSLTGNAAPTRVSPSGGFEPIWSRDGREIYYRENRKLMAVTVEPGSDEFRFKSPVALFDNAGVSEGQTPSYDVLPDGRFIMFSRLEELDAPISVVVNWSELLKGRAAGR